MTGHKYPPDQAPEQERPAARLPFDWKTVISVGAMVFGVGVGIKIDITELRKDVAGLERTTSRIETNSVTKDGVAELVRAEMRQAQRDADEAVQRAKRQLDIDRSPIFSQRRGPRPGLERSEGQ